MVSENIKINNEVSALKSTLKLLMNILKRIKFFLGRILVDILMRDIVKWYDVRHSYSTKNSDNDQEEINNLTSKIQYLQSVIIKSEESIESFKSKEFLLIKEKESLMLELLNNKNNNIALEEENRNLESLNSELINENNKLLRRCMPESEIPSMIYYAQGDSSGLFLRKISTVKTTQNIYKITTDPGDSYSAAYEPDIDSDIYEIIDNRNLTLVACEIMCISPNANKIIVKQPGRVKYENNKWKVVSKVKIILS